jgi:hypothetical protein
MRLVTESPALRGLRPGNRHAGNLDPAGSSSMGDGSEPGVRHRSHGRPGRERRVNLRLSGEEYSALVAAAGMAGLTPAGFATEAALAAARGEAVPDHGRLRQLLLELMAARTQVRRYGVNVNRAVAQLQAAGEAPGWLERAAAGADRGVARLDAAAGEVAGVLRRRAGR